MNEQKENPFKIHEGVNLDEIGGSSVLISEKQKFLIESLKELPIDKNKSLYFNKDYFKNHAAVYSSIKNAQVYIQKKFPELKEITFTLRSFKNVQDEWIGTRVWRIN